VREPVAAESGFDRSDRVPRHDQHETDAAVERAPHLRIRDRTLALQPAEYRRLRPLADAFPEQSRTVSNEESGKDEYYNNIVHGRHQRDEFRQALADTKGYGRSERRFLTDPPLDYREPVATAPTSEEALLPKKKKGNFLTRWWRGS